MITTNKNLNYEFKKIGRCETKFDKQIQLRYVLNLNLFLDGFFFKKWEVEEEVVAVVAEVESPGSKRRSPNSSETLRKESPIKSKPI